MSVIFNVLIAARLETRCFVWLLFSRQWNSENKRKVSESELKRKLLTLALWWLLSCAFSRFCFSIEISGKVKFHLINREKWHLCRRDERHATVEMRGRDDQRGDLWCLACGRCAGFELDFLPKKIPHTKVELFLIENLRQSLNPSPQHTHNGDKVTPLAPSPNDFFVSVLNPKSDSRISNDSK